MSRSSSRGGMRLSARSSYKSKATETIDLTVDSDVDMSDSSDTDFVQAQDESVSDEEVDDELDEKSDSDSYESSAPPPKRQTRSAPAKAPSKAPSRGKATTAKKVKPASAKKTAKPAMLGKAIRTNKLSVLERREQRALGTRSGIKLPKSSAEKGPEDPENDREEEEEEVEEEETDEIVDDENAVMDGTAKKSVKVYHDKFIFGSGSCGISEDLKPINAVRPAFEDMLNNLRSLYKAEALMRNNSMASHSKKKKKTLLARSFSSSGAPRETMFKKYLDQLGKKKLSVATFCSGTESPILALDIVAQILSDEGTPFGVDHKMSAEIVAWKQAYINLNFKAGVILQDITEFFKLRKLAKEDPGNFKSKFEVTSAFGGTTKVADDIDLLVAGTCCVDFSRLNSSRKALNAGGESGDTFFAMREYAQKYRPKVIILENVIGAPWSPKKGNPRGMDTEMQAIGYATKVVKLDTKDYYIPHTRQRCYMLCVDQENCPDNVFVVRQKLEDWERLVLALSRKASCPTEQWIFRSDDPRLNRSTMDVDTGRKPPQWERCKLGHNVYRASLGLGDRRPLTQWVADGSYTIPDYWKRGQSGLVERVLDTADVCHLRNLNRNVDDRYYTRMQEFSQNVFRVTDTVKNGIVGCQTPNGFPFPTTRGGRIEGIESLVLQGLPVDQLDLSRISSTERQNLAGNAMSSTVVGACILSTLAVFADHFEFNGSINDEAKLDVRETIAESQHLKYWKAKATSYEPLSSQRAMEEAKLTRRMCYCEGRFVVKDSVIQECQTCHHTACSDCGKSPKHNYVRLPQSVTKTRKDPIRFEHLLRKSIPQELKISSLGSDDLEKYLNDFRNANREDIDRETWNMVEKHISDALKSKVYLTTIRRSERWEVTYESNHARILLTISETEVRWDIYANMSDVPLASSEGKLLRQFPIARMSANGGDITKGDWKFWLPKVNEFPATLTMSGELVESYKNTSGLTAAENTHVFQNVVVDIPNLDSRCFEAKEICGEYMLSQECGQAFNTLHVQKDSLQSPSSRRFLYFEQPERTGDPEDFYWIFTSDTRRLEKLDPREFVCRVDKKYRHPIGHMSNRKEGDNPRQVLFPEMGITSTDGNAKVSVQTKIYCDGMWVDFPAIDFNKANVDSVLYGHLPEDISNLSVPSCKEQLPVFVCEGKVDYEDFGRKWLKNTLIEVKAANKADFIHNFRWLLERGLETNGHVEESTTWHSLSDKNPFPCPECEPPLPTYKWMFKKTKTKERQVPYEDRTQAAKFERAFKGRPSPMSIFFEIDDNDHIRLIITVNPEALAHRAVANLRSQNSENIADISTSWRFISDSKSQAKCTVQPLEIKVNAGDPSKNRSQPNDFRATLRPEQLRAFTWMVNQETSPPAFDEIEVEETEFPEIGYRLEAKASRKTKAPGGIVAFDVAFGKTALVLALMLEMKDADKKHGGKAILNGIPLQASLILVPHHLTSQWNTEVAKFTELTPKKGEVVVIKDIKALRKYTVEDFKKAKVIIFNINLLENQNYLSELANFAGLVDIDHLATVRAKSAWRKEATTEARKNVDSLLQDPNRFASRLLTKYKENLKNAKSENPTMPSKRFNGALYTSKDDESKATQNASEPTSEDVTMSDATHNKSSSNKRKRLAKDDGNGGKEAEDLTGKARGKPKPEYDETRKAYFDSIKTVRLASAVPLLEMFSFSRLVIDEYTYLTKGMEDAIKLIKAVARWILSGTPLLGSFSDIKRMAALIGINLGIDDYSSMASDVLDQVTKDMTTVETFLSYQPARSFAWWLNRHIHCQDFLNAFARRDHADLTGIKCVKTYRLVEHSLAEFGMYQEAQQRMASMNFDTSLRVRESISDADKRFKLAVAQLKDMREGLLHLAAHARPFDDDADQEDPRSACDRIYDTREEQLEEILDNIDKDLKKAVWLHRNQDPSVKKDKKLRARFPNWRSSVENNAYKDLGSTKILGHHIRDAWGNYQANDWELFYRKKDIEKGTKEEIDDEEKKHMYPSGMVQAGNTQHLTQAESQLRQAIVLLNRQAEVFVNHSRSLRFLEAFIQAQERKMVCCGCKKANTSIDRFTLLSKCGHLICGIKDCANHNEGVCPIEGCQEANASYQIIPTSTFVNKPDPVIPTRYGQKMADMVSLIQEILEKGDRIIVFVQFSNILEKVVAALEDGGIDFISLSSARDKAAKLVNFQEGKAKAKVLVLNLGDASASGANLTIANHVLFVSPFYVTGSSAQAQWVATMKQAIGRARRYGQKKIVNVYHFATTNTIDIDILEHRLRKHKSGPKILEQDQNDSRVGRHIPRPANLVKTPLSSAVSHLIFSGHEHD
ncbi:hypothetical protein B0J14DRAFT_562341 [Halenospora varia]|nr:hypothetical protein B0J14DRAFT_562341 [Halenospora varia]